MGQAYLGFCEETQLQNILQALRDQEVQEDCILESDSKIKRYIAAVQDRGYGLRVGNRGESTHMAIPIKSDHQIIGVIGLSIFSSCFNDKVAKEYLALLRKSAGEIVDSMDKMMALAEHSAT